LGDEPGFSFDDFIDTTTPGLHLGFFTSFDTGRITSPAPAFDGHDDILGRNDDGAVSIGDNGQIGSAHIVANAGTMLSGWHIA
jgi:hypothetical protein